MKIISVFDTSISDFNLGNAIIMEAIYQQLYQLFPRDFFFKLPYMEITEYTTDYIKRSDLLFFGGTNSLCGEMEKYTQWGVTDKNCHVIKDLIYIGIGWWQYQENVSAYTKNILKRVLSTRHLHSVRDSYTAQKLHGLGFHNVVNTGCPTLWELKPDQIPAAKADQVVATFTDYHQQQERDTFIVQCLKRHYHTIFYWVQGPGDYQYIKNIDQEVKEEAIIAPRLDHYDQILMHHAIDYVGTRLHAGIRALQKGKRALIIGIDSRALEMQKDFHLPVLPANELHKLEEYIGQTGNTKIMLPYENIHKWKNQFLLEGW